MTETGEIIVVSYLTLFKSSVSESGQGSFFL